MTTVEIEAPTECLYVKWPGQLCPEKVCIELACRTGRLSCVVTERDSVPESVWHGRAIRWDLEGAPRLKHAKDLLEEVSGLAQRVLNGYSENNDEGDFDDDAKEASAEIERIAREDQWDENTHENVWDAWEWVTAHGLTPPKKVAEVWGIMPDMSDEQTTVVEQKMRDEAELNGITLEGCGHAIERIALAIALIETNGA